MGKTSRRSSEDYSSKKRHHRRGSSSPRRRSPSDRGKTKVEKITTLTPASRRDKVDLKSLKARSSRADPKRRSRSRSDSRSSYSRSSSRHSERKESPHVTTRRMSMQQHTLSLLPNDPIVVEAIKNEGDFDNFPEITQKSRDSLKARGINYLFPVQFESFRSVWARKDLIVRDLTGSGKTLGFGLPMVEYLRKNKCLGTGRI